MADRNWKNPAESQMGGKMPDMKPSNGVMDHNPCPTFDKKHDTGNGGIPLVFETKMPGQPAKLDVMGGPGQFSGLSSPSASGPSRPRERARVPGNQK